MIIYWGLLHWTVLHIAKNTAVTIWPQGDRAAHVERTSNCKLNYRDEDPTLIKNIMVQYT